KDKLYIEPDSRCLKDMGGFEIRKNMSIIKCIAKHPLIYSSQSKSYFNKMYEKELLISTDKQLFLVHFIKIARSEEHTSELQSRFDLVCRLLLEKKKKQ